MPQRVKMQTPEGVRELEIYGDNIQLAIAYRNGVVKVGDEVVYRNMISRIIGTVRDEDGLEWTELMPLAPLQNLTFTIHM